MAASTSDVQRLVTRLRGKGLDDSQVSESLRGMGYSKSDAAAAVQTNSSSGSASSSTRAGGQAGGPTAQAGDTSGDPAGDAGSSSGGPSLGSFMPSMPSVSPTLTPPRRLDGGDVAGFAAGLLLYTLALNYIRFGKAGVTGWLSAKFLNRVTVGGSVTGASTGQGWGQETLALQSGTVQARGLTSTRPRMRKV